MNHFKEFMRLLHLKRLGEKLLRQENASAIIEFSLLLPILFTLFFGLVEFSRYILINQKLEKTVNTMADLITQSEKICQQELNTYRQVANQIMNPINFSTGTVTFSSVVNYTTATPPCNANQACISWQQTPGNTGRRTKIGNVGSRPTLPNNMQVQAGQNYIVAEVFYNFKPLFLMDIPGIYDSIDNKEGNNALYRIAIFKPRLNSLSTLNATCQ